MGSDARLAVVAIATAIAVPGCSALGLFSEPIDVPCADDAACAGAIDDPCRRAVCDRVAGYCVAADADRDEDGESPLACGDRALLLPATDCDDGDQHTAAGAPDTCNEHDDDCDGAIDEGCVPVTQVAASVFHTCALRGGEVFCWGTGPSLGLGPTVRSTAVPRRVEGVADVVAIDVGRAATCALDRAGTVWCWSLADAGPIPAGAPASVPTAIELPRPAIALEVEGLDACAILDDRSVSCWSAPDALASALAGSDGGLGPVAVDAGGPAIDLGLALSVVCIAREDGRVACAGIEFANIVDPPEDTYVHPVPLVRDDPTSVRELVGGFAAMCAIDEGGALACWGSDFYGVLGTPTGIAPVPTPVALALPPVVRASFGSIDGTNIGLCAHHAGGEATCVGGSFGSITLVTQPALRGASGVAIGRDHACAWWPAGPVRCWGEGEAGQLGLGTTEDVAEPREVRGL